MGADGQGGIVVREATPADLAAVTGIYADEVANGSASFEVQPPDLAEMTARFEAIRAGGYPWIVAERDGDVLGYAYAGAYHKRAAYRFTVEDSVYVARAGRGMGVGRALLGALIGRCEEAGLSPDDRNHLALAKQRCLDRPAPGAGLRNLGGTAGRGLQAGRLARHHHHAARPGRRRADPAASGTLNRPVGRCQALTSRRPLSSTRSTRDRSWPRLRTCPVAATTA